MEEDCGQSRSLVGRCSIRLSHKWLLLQAEVGLSSIPISVKFRGEITSLIITTCHCRQRGNEKGMIRCELTSLVNYLDRECHLEVLEVYLDPKLSRHLETFVNYSEYHAPSFVLPSFKRGSNTSVKWYSVTHCST